MPYLVIGSDNREYGPADIAKLREWAGRGQVAAETILVDTETGARFPASTLEELRPLFQPRYVFEPTWTPPPAYTPRTLPQKSARWAVEAVVGVVVAAALLVGVAAVYVFASRPHRGWSSGSSNWPAGPRTWTYSTRSDGRNSVIDTDGVTVVYQGNPIHGGWHGFLQLEGANASESSMGRDGSDRYADGVATLTVEGRTLRFENAGEILALGAQRFDLRGGKKMVVVRPDGSAAMVDPLAVPDLPPDRAYAAVIRVWSGGNQQEAERMLAGYLRRYPDDQRLALFRAACARSRFDVKAADPLLQQVVKMKATSEQGKCAAAVLALDQRRDVEAQFDVLRALVLAHPNDPLPLWMLAVECRSYERNDEGAACYAKLLRMVGKGSSLVHQTYANLLDALGKHREALPHRYLAVRLEPADWSYDGLANTLDALGEHMTARAVRNVDAPDHKQPSLPAHMAFSEPERRRVFREDRALFERISRQHGGGPVSMEDPAIVALRRRNHVTEDQMDEIDVEAVSKHWDRPFSRR